MTRTREDTVAEPAILQGVFDRTAGLLDGIGREQWELPTPCPDYDVAALAGHLVEFLRTFAAAVSGQSAAAQLTDAQPTGDGPAREFRAAADLAVEGWRDGAAQRLVTVGPDEVPGALAFDLMLVECLTHGWDVAVATGQPAPYTDAQAEAALAAVTPMLTADSRGPGHQFGAAVPVPDDAGPMARLVGFLGRDPDHGSPR
ncbi:MAG: TIGR03086 family protein [Pseudonocardiaceae bacterium]|nr:TIGR03086 family protein [Pseudonocardiaceae bacterium]